METSKHRLSVNNISLLSPINRNPTRTKSHEKESHWNDNIVQI